MTFENDCSKLRPFDLEAAKAGEPLCDKRGNGEWKYVAGPDSCGDFCLRTPGGKFVSGIGCGESSVRMAPLAWLKGDPVYKGDILYSSFFAESDHLCATPGNNGKFIVSGVDSRGYLLAKNRSPVANTDIHSCSWAPPKVKREGWINIYKSSETAVNAPCETDKFPYKTEKLANQNIWSGRGRLACLRIEWEE